MKKLIISMLAVAALAGCSKNENGTNGKEEERVPILLGANVVTKASVSGSATVQIEGWENTGTSVYSVASTWQSEATVSVAATAAAITLTPSQYYNADDEVFTHVRGWYPKVAAAADGTVTFSNTDGTVDVLLSNELSGTKTLPITESALKFDHETAQLIFKVVKGTGLADGTKIKSIKLKGASVPTSIDLTKSSLDNDVLYTPILLLSVPNIAPTEITTTGAVVGEPLMIKPVADNTTLKLDIETVKADGTTAVATYEDLTFTTDGGKIEIEKSYTITLTFGQAGISFNAHITDWVSAAGTGTVQ